MPKCLDPRSSKTYYKDPSDFIEFDFSVLTDLLNSSIANLFHGSIEKNIAMIMGLRKELVHCIKYYRFEIVNVGPLTNQLNHAIILNCT